MLANKCKISNWEKREKNIVGVLTAQQNIFLEKNVINNVIVCFYFSRYNNQTQYMKWLSNWYRLQFGKCIIFSLNEMKKKILRKVETNS